MCACLYLLQMEKVVRESSFRHVYCQPRKDDQYTNLKIGGGGGLASSIKANSGFFAVPWDVGGGALAVIPLQMKGRLLVSQVHMHARTHSHTRANKVPSLAQYAHPLPQRAHDARTHRKRQRF